MPIRASTVVEQDSEQGRGGITRPRMGRLRSVEQNWAIATSCLHYRLSGPDLASGLMCQGKTENIFLMMVQPPAQPGA